MKKRISSHSRERERERDREREGERKERGYSLRVDVESIGHSSFGIKVTCFE